MVSMSMTASRSSSEKFAAFLKRRADRGLATDAIRPAGRQRRDHGSNGEAASGLSRRSTSCGSSSTSCAMMKLSIGDDGRNRFDFNTFGSLTMRCQPAPPRTSWPGRDGCGAGVGRPAPARSVLAVVDYVAQEFGYRREPIGDPVMQKAYRGEDVHIGTAIAAEAAPSGHQGHSPGPAQDRQRNQFLPHVWRRRARVGARSCAARTRCGGALAQ